MALTKEKKQEVVEEIMAFLDNSKMTVLATYKGTSVKSMQSLRKSAKENETTIKVVKNRLAAKAISSIDKFKDIETDKLKGQLLYAFNASDEVAPAQVLFNFSKQAPGLEFVGAITDEGLWLQADEVTSLANLPSKDQLRAMVVGTIKAPLSGFATVMSGNLTGLITVLNAKAEQG